MDDVVEEVSETELVVDVVSSIDVVVEDVIEVVGSNEVVEEDELELIVDVLLSCSTR